MHHSWSYDIDVWTSRRDNVFLFGDDDRLNMLALG